MSGIYHVEYDGYYRMKWHDDEENALKRWFENYKVERYASFASDCEWLVVKEVDCDAKSRRKRLVCEIGDDGRGTKREVIMDHTTPPAPMITFAAKRRWEPPPPKSPAEQRREEEWHRMSMMGYEPVYRPKRKPLRAIDFSRPFSMMDMMEDMTVEYEVEWVRRRPMFYDVPRAPLKAPPPPKHRRNA